MRRYYVRRIQDAEGVAVLLLLVSEPIEKLTRRNPAGTRIEVERGPRGAIEDQDVPGQSYSHWSSLES
jgi:hypothetical protein